MEIAWSNGYKLSIEHFPGRKKPVMVLSKDGGYLAHAVLKDEESFGEFVLFFKLLWGDNQCD